MEVGQEAQNLLARTYRDKALDTFIRGLNGDLPKLLGMKEPIDLPQALHLCLKLENQNFRANHAFTNRNNTLQHRRAFQNTPPIPARRVEPKRFEGGRPPFCPQISHLPMVRTRMEVNRNFQQQNNNYGQKNDNYVPQRPTAQIRSRDPKQWRSAKVSGVEP